MSVFVMNWHLLRFLLPQRSYFDYSTTKTHYHSRKESNCEHMRPLCRPDLDSTHQNLIRNYSGHPLTSCTSVSAFGEEFLQPFLPSFPTSLYSGTNRDSCWVEHHKRDISGRSPKCVPSGSNYHSHDTQNSTGHWLGNRCRQGDWSAKKSTLLASRNLSLCVNLPLMWLLGLKFKRW